ncbi:MAG: phosphodiester glycosidase family protein, partial [Actinomycetota bacterium]
RKSSSVGMTLIGFAGYLRDLGAVNAVNLDGGGGSTMWVKGQGIVNDPSDSGGERAVTNVVLVLPGADPGEPVMSRVSAQLGLTVGGEAMPTLLSRTAARRTQGASAADAGSTGGLLQAFGL